MDGSTDGVGKQRQGNEMDSDKGEGGRLNHPEELWVSEGNKESAAEKQGGCLN